MTHRSLPAQFSLYVHKGGLKPNLFNLLSFCRDGIRKGGLEDTEMADDLENQRQF